MAPVILPQRSITDGPVEHLYDHETVRLFYNRSVSDPWWVDARDYGVVGDGVTDDTVALQAAIDASTSVPKRPVFLPAGEYLVTQLLFKEGAGGIIGAGLASAPHYGTTIWQADGVDASCLVNDPSLTGTEYWHWPLFENFLIRKVAGFTDTLGSGMEIDCRIGENFRVRRVHAINFPESGLRFNRGGTNLQIDSIGCFGNDAYGIDLRRTGSDVWQTVEMHMISGDNNGTALIHVNVGGSAQEYVTIQGVKAESNGTDQVDVVLLENVSSMAVAIRDVSAIKVGGGGSADNVVRVQNSTGYPHLQLQNIHTDGNYTNILSGNLGPTISNRHIGYAVAGFSHSGIQVEGSSVGFFGAAPASKPTAYTPTNVTPDKAFNADATTVEELADVLGTLIADLQTLGLVG